MKIKPIPNTDFMVWLFDLIKTNLQLDVTDEREQKQQNIALQLRIMYLGRLLLNYDIQHNELKGKKIMECGVQCVSCAVWHVATVSKF